MKNKIQVTKEQIIYKIDRLLEQGETITLQNRAEVAGMGYYESKKYQIGEIVIFSDIGGWYLDVMNERIDLSVGDSREVFQYIQELFRTQFGYEKEQKIKKINEYLKQ
jgi:hypothetical protein